MRWTKIKTFLTQISCKTSRKLMSNWCEIFSLWKECLVIWNWILPNNLCSISCQFKIAMEILTFGWQSLKKTSIRVTFRILSNKIWEQKIRKKTKECKLWPLSVEASCQHMTWVIWHQILQVQMIGESVRQGWAITVKMKILRRTIYHPCWIQETSKKPF